jgi:hypothetical protein
MFGAKPISDVFFNAKPFTETSKRKDVLNDVCRDLLPLKPGQLVEITHWRKGAWAKHYVPGLKGTVIPDESIKEEYEELVREGILQPN